MKPGLLIHTCSRFFSARQIKGVLRLGDAVIPGDKQLPPFSDTEFVHHIDRMLEYMEVEDREGLGLLMNVFSITPIWKIRLLIKCCDLHKILPSTFGTPFRLLNLGLKGIIFTLYYSGLEDKEGHGARILKTIGWDAQTPSYQPPEYAMTQNREVSPKDIAQKAKNSCHEIRTLTVSQRLKFVTQLKQLIVSEREIIIERIQSDTNKSRSDALVSEIFGVLDHLAFLESQAISALKDEKIKTPIALLGKSSKVYYEPLGTILIISPWNYPFYQAIVPIMAAFIAGNAVIYKPSEFTPLTGLVEDLMSRIGMKDDWVQVVYGDGKIGSSLIDQAPNKIFFTGSVATGKKIMAQAAQYLIPVELELGGKDPSIVFADANLDRAASGVVWGSLTNCGQSCTSVERVYVQDTCYEDFRHKTLAIVNQIKQSRDYNGDSDIGGMTTAAQIAIVKQHVDDALAKGATLLSGNEWDGKDAMIPPLLFDNVSDDMLIAHEETFGPTIVLLKFSDEQEVISRANDSIYGLSASVWSGDKARCDRVARALEVGNVSINNVMLTEGNHHLPFGGVKQSGIGRYKGVHGLRSFCNLKSILIDANSKKIEANWFPYTKKKYQLFSAMTEALFSGGFINFVKFAFKGILLETLSQKSRNQSK
tara:strand:+ start:1140 stop:3083 length:1944 start_codon:yes stop_codon:yes gene_type:complete